MQDPQISDPGFAYPLLSRLGLLFLLFFLGMFFSQAALQVWLLQSGLDLESILREVRSGVQEGNVLILLMQAFNQIFGFGMAVVLAGKFNGESAEIMPVGRPDLVVLAGSGILVLLCFPIIPFISWNPDTFFLPESLKAVELLLKQAETEAEALLNGLTQGEQAVPRISQILVFAVLPGICEELFFRGAIQHYFSRRFNPVISVWLTGLLFSLIHFQVYGFFARFLLGVLFGYLVLWTQSLMPAMWGHFIFNASSLLVSWQKDSRITQQLEEISWYWGVLSLALLTFVLFRFRKYALNRFNHEPEV
jgi:membrane protease YdiL (CAAX protease family)